MRTIFDSGKLILFKKIIHSQVLKTYLFTDNKANLEIIKYLIE